jgi:hypothetical protein
MHAWPLYRRPKTVHALARDQGFEALVIGIQGADATSVTALSLSPKLIRLRKEPPRIQRDNVDLQFLGEDRLGNRLILYAEARREDDSAADFTAHGRDALREVKPRKCDRDDEKLVPRNICVGQGRPPLQCTGTINEATRLALAIRESGSSYFRIDQRAETGR